MENTALENRLKRAEAKVDILERMIEEKTRQVYLEQQELRLAHDYMTTIFDALEGCLLVVDQDFKISKANRKTFSLLEYAEDELLGKSATTILADKTCFESKQKFAESQQLGFRGETFFVSKSGQKIPMMFAARNIFQEGAFHGLVCIAQDISEKKDLEAQLLQSQKLESIGQLAAGIAHEINTPIQFIGDNSRFLQDSMLDIRSVITEIHELIKSSASEYQKRLADLQTLLKEKDTEYLLDEIPKAIEQSLDGVARVSKIVRAMKEFAHPGREQMQAVDLNRLVESTTIVCTNEWKYVADLKFSPDPNLPLIPCLPGQINQVILNIIVNAAHAIEASANAKKTKGSITVNTRLADNMAEISIADSGTGIAKDISNKIYDPFFTTKEVGKGTGQGLALSRSIVVDQHGGCIDFDSEFGKGTTFYIRLPLKAKT